MRAIDAHISVTFICGILLQPLSLCFSDIQNNILCGAAVLR